MNEDNSNKNQLVIPRIIHQTWKTAEIPEIYKDFQQSWLRNMPDWEYRLWTDDDNRAFLKRHYEWFLPIYDAYPQTIMKVDAVRYFWMFHYGGLYVDLDFEALKSVEPLLKNQKIVLGLEPREHMDNPKIQQHGYPQLLCNAFMASVPKASFWESVFRQMVKSKNEKDPLVATGPVCLTAAYEKFANQQDIQLINPELLYPITQDDGYANLMNNSGSELTISTHAYAVHHWSGSWWRHTVNREKKGVIGKVKKKLAGIFTRNNKHRV